MKDENRIAWSYLNDPGFDLMDFTPEQKAKLMAAARPRVTPETVELWILRIGILSLAFAMAMGWVGS